MEENVQETKLDGIKVRCLQTKKWLCKNCKTVDKQH